MDRPLIAISGKMKSGKTTLATILSEELGIPRIPLALPIKLGAGPLGDPDPFGEGKLRWLQQGIGKLCTDHDTNWFTDLWFDKNPDFRETGAICDDVRRIPEYERFRDEGFLMVRLDVTKDHQILRGAPSDTLLLEHPTETELDHAAPEDWDLQLSAYSTVPQRIARVLALLQTGPYYTGSLPPLTESLLKKYEGKYSAAGNRIGEAISGS